jgi:DNA-binding transcriptional MerR regulator
MLIGELAAKAGVSVQTLRYYERRGLMSKARKTASGYRQFGVETVRTVRFIRRAQSLGFTLDEIRDLLGLWAESAKSCGAAERRARATLSRIESKIGALSQMQAALAQYVSACRNRETMQDCPLLAAIGGPGDDSDA